jgi:hypothetical protein
MTYKVNIKGPKDLILGPFMLIYLVNDLLSFDFKLYIKVSVDQV